MTSILKGFSIAKGERGDNNNNNDNMTNTGHRDDDSSSKNMSVIFSNKLDKTSLETSFAIVEEFE